MKSRRVSPMPDHRGVRGHAPEDQEHDGRLHEHRVDRIGPGQDEAGHGAREEDEAHRLRALDLGGEGGAQRSPHVRARRVRPRLAEGEARLHLGTVVGQLGDHRRAADTVLLIELPIIIPAIGTMARGTTG